MTSTFKMLIKESINFFIFLNLRYAHQMYSSTCDKFVQHIAYYSSESVFQVNAYIRFSDFQSKSELLITEKVLPFADEVIVVFVHKC